MVAGKHSGARRQNADKSVEEERTGREAEDCPRGDFVLTVTHIQLRGPGQMTQCELDL